MQRKPKAPANMEPRCRSWSLAESVDFHVINETSDRFDTYERMRYMKYITGHVWLNSNSQENTNQESILLQQVTYGKCNVVLACVCNGGVLGGYITGRLKNWLQSKVAELFGGKRENEQVKKALYKELSTLQKDVQNYCDRISGKEDLLQLPVNLSGILIADQDCFLIHGGESCCYLLNRKFERTHRKRIGQDKYISWQITEGRIQKNVGILLGMRTFLHSVSKEVMLQCLAAQDIEREEQIDKRLTEMAVESRRQGYQGECSAVYIRSI